VSDPASPIASYAAVAMQLTARSVERCPDATATRAQILSHIAEIENPLRGAKIFIEQFQGSPVRLAVLPEYLFTSYPGRIGISEFADRAAFAADGPEYAALGGVAQRLGLFLAGNAYESDPHFPGFYFQTSFLIDPAGAVVLRYRRLISMFAPSPHDVWDAYLDRYGIEGVFPVADTAIGRVAAIASEEILYPEVARALAFRGAELFVHSSSEIGSPLGTAKDVAKRARAWENMAYVISANTAGIADCALPLASADGNSQIVGPDGKVLAQSGAGETFTAFAEVDIARLRALRRVPAMTNSLARQRPGLFAGAYAAATGQDANAMLDHCGTAQVPERDHFVRAQAAVIEKLSKAGVI
jgi:predicted amidohydrolase